MTSPVSRQVRLSFSRPERSPADTDELAGSVAEGAGRSGSQANQCVYEGAGHCVEGAESDPLGVGMGSAPINAEKNGGNAGVREERGICPEWLTAIRGLFSGPLSQRGGESSYYCLVGINLEGAP